MPIELANLNIINYGYFKVQEITIATPNIAGSNYNSIKLAVSPDLTHV